MHLGAPDLELRRRARLTRLLRADAELLEQFRVVATRLGLHVDVTVDDHEAAVFETREGIHLGERQVVAQEDLHQLVDDRRESVEVAARDAGRADRFLGDARGQRQEAREVGLGDVLRVRLGDHLDVDASHVAEDQHRALASPIPGHGREVLHGDRAARLDEHRARLLALDLDRQDRLEASRGVVGRVGEADRSSPHAAPGEHLTLEDDRAADRGEGGSRLLGRVDEEAVTERESVAGEQGLGFVLVESQFPPRAAAAAGRHGASPRTLLPFRARFNAPADVRRRGSASRAHLHPGGARWLPVAAGVACVSHRSPSRGLTVPWHPVRARLQRFPRGRAAVRRSGCDA